MEKGVKDKFGIVLFAVMLLAMTFTKANPVILVILSAAAGILCKSLRNVADKNADKGGKDK